MRSGHTERMVLEGVLIPVAWGVSGEALDVSIMTFDEEEYPIDSATAREHRLSDQVRKHVRLSAVVQDRRVIDVSDVEVLGKEGSR